MTEQASSKLRFEWTSFYEEFANKLVDYKDDRESLLEVVKAISDKMKNEGVPFTRLEDYLTIEDQDKENSIFLYDICPFTVLGTFNRRIIDPNRIRIAAEWASYLDIKSPIPNTFEAVPKIDSQRSWYFSFAYHRGKDDINNLWNLFEYAIGYANNLEGDNEKNLYDAYEKAIRCWGSGWNLSMGLYWIRPWQYVTLDSLSQDYITEKLNLEIGKSINNKYSSAQEYFELINRLEKKFQDSSRPVKSFPELALAAWEYRHNRIPTQPNTNNYNIEKFSGKENKTANQPSRKNTYTIDNIIADGCFFERKSIAKIIDQLDSKKNIILQGPPGTGKTWLAKKLGYALMGQKNDNHLRAVQFHPNLSYEDFVRGWRPSGEGKLTLVDGPFLEMVDAAKKDASIEHVIVIEEINRGNPAQIFGEMLTLLEDNKRTPNEALELSYRKDEFERIHIPANLYVIGTMNIADRSLALVDLALRRRFAFFNLQPTFGAKWRDWVHTQAGIDIEFLRLLGQRLDSLNEDIAKDRNLGPQFKIGHSYVTPSSGDKIEDAAAWLMGIVETEIGPLLEEYFFDDIDRVDKLKGALVEGI